MFGFLITLFRLISEKNEMDGAKMQLTMDNIRWANMDPFDSAEEQVRKHYEFYSIGGDCYDCGIWWRGDQNKYITTNLRTIKYNKEYRKSGLTEEEFAEQHFIKIYKECDGRFAPWDSRLKLQIFDDDGSATEWELYLYIDDGYAPLMRNGERIKKIRIEK